MTIGTSIDQIYEKLGDLIERATGRTVFYKDKVQTVKTGPRALVFISESSGMQQNVIERLDVYVYATGEKIEQVPWSTSFLDIIVEFYGNQTDDSARDAAQRLKQALYLEERYWDLWEYCALTGAVKIIDVSTMFREDIEPRAETRFQVVANICYPLPLQDKNLFDIETQTIGVRHIKQDDEETIFEIDLNNDENEDSSIE